MFWQKTYDEHNSKKTAHHTSLSRQRKDQHFTDATTLREHHKRKKREHLSDVGEPSISKDPPLNQTCRHCQQQIIGQPILLIFLTQRTKRRNRGSSANINQDRGREKEMQIDVKRRDSTKGDGTIRMMTSGN